MKTLYLNEDAYHNGLKKGALFADWLNKAKEEYLEKLKCDSTAAQVKHAENLLKSEYPDALEEMYGRADGAGIERDVVILMGTPEILRKKDGCTTIITKGKDGIVFSHNEDEWYKDFNPHSTALFSCPYKNRTIYAYTNACKTVGSCFGFNDKGLLISCNNIMSDRVQLDHVSRYILSRNIYFADSFEEAVNIVTSMKPASAFSVNIADVFRNKACNIERDIDDCTVTMLEDSLVHSNHFLHKEGKTDACSLFRYQKPAELLNTGMNPKEILEYRTDIYEQSVRLADPHNEGKGITVANMTWDPLTRTLCIDDVLEGTSLEFVLQ